MSKRDSNLRVEFANMWREWLGEETTNYFEQNGYYAKEYETFKVIAFDS